MTNSVKINSIFSYILKGTISDLPVEVPFISLGDIDKYADGLIWAHNKYNIGVNLEILDKDGDKIGHIRVEPFITQ